LEFCADRSGQFGFCEGTNSILKPVIEGQDYAISGIRETAGMVKQVVDGYFARLFFIRSPKRMFSTTDLWGNNA
jgi:hypothetical protein